VKDYPGQCSTVGSPLEYFATVLWGLGNISSLIARPCTYSTA
jgi:hypothetical protein